MVGPEACESAPNCNPPIASDNNLIKIDIFDLSGFPIGAD